MTLTEPAVVHYRSLPPAQPFNFPATTTFADVVTGGGVLIGWAVEETTGAAGARVVIGDGTNGGVITNAIAPVRLVGGESNREYPPGGILFYRSASVQVTSGTVAGSLWVVLLTPDTLNALLAWSNPEVT